VLTHIEQERYGLILFLFLFDCFLIALFDFDFGRGFGFDFDFDFDFGRGGRLDFARVVFFLVGDGFGLTGVRLFDFLVASVDIGACLFCVFCRW
jgi:hypothetical protein